MSWPSGFMFWAPLDSDGGVRGGGGGIVRLACVTKWGTLHAFRAAALHVSKALVQGVGESQDDAF
jgi:hypothetical protein